jgi:predicted ArsR family transcriptional regulator
VKNEVANINRPGWGPRPVTPAAERRALSPARAAVLDAVQEAGEPATLTVLSEATGLHPNTLREHLEALVARGLVRRTRSAPSGRGRPAWLFSPADPDLGATGSEYAGLAATLAAHIHRTSAHPGEDAVAAGRAWGRDLARKAGPPAQPGPVGARRQVARLLEEVGFAPVTDDKATTVRLTRCPLLETAKEFPDVVCGVHLGIVRGALEEYGADSDRTDLFAFSEPGACRLELLTRGDRR